MSHVRRLVALILGIFAVAILAIVLDGVIPPLLDAARDMGAFDSQFGQVFEFADSIRWVLVPGMILGLVLWYLYGTVREERREEEIRRVRRP